MLKKIISRNFFKVFKLEKFYTLTKKLLSFTMENDNKIQLNEDCQSKNEHKLKAKSEKKSNKKLAKAIHVLKFHEGGNNMKREIFSKTIENKLWIYHFGNGDEDDQKSIKKYFTNKFGNSKIYIFPGISYGFLELEDISVLEKSPISGMIDKSYPFWDFSIEFASGIRKIFAFCSSLPLKEVQENNTSTFPIASYEVDIPGLYIINDFITEEEEKQLIESIDLNEWTKLTNRKVQHYGYEFIYGANNVNKSNKIGDLPYLGVDMRTKFENLLKNFYKDNNEKGEVYKMSKEDNKIPSDSFFHKFGNFDQLTINDYHPGEGIPPHWDSHSPFEDLFCSLSLSSGVVMTFNSPDEPKISKHVYLKPRSLAIFTGDVRYKWEHSISLRKIDRVEDAIYFRKRRVSMTYRKIRTSECQCPHVQFCDSQKNLITKVSAIENYELSNMIKESNSINSNSSTVPTEIEKKHVYDVYEKIAPHFSHTRYKPWPKVAEYLNNLEPGSLNIDVGCGNGKYLNVNEKVITIGTDRSFNLIKICREKNNSNQVFVADSLKLPLRDNCFDSAISIAVVHHFSNVDLRIQALQELIRVLKTGGTLLIYVWAIEQDEKKFKQQDNFVPWHLQSNYENEQTVESLGPEIVKEEKKNATVYHRYYHMFKKGELESLILNLPNVKILESYYDHANWCCIVKREN